MKELTAGERKKAFNKWVKHLIDIEFYGNSIEELTVDKFLQAAEKIEKILKKQTCISTKKQYREILGQIYVSVDNFISWLEESMQKKSQSIIKNESSWMLDFAAIFGLSYLLPKTISSQVLFTPASGQTLKSRLNMFTLKLKTKLDNLLRVAYVTGGAPGDGVQEVTAASKEIGKGMKEFSSATFRNTQSVIFRNNTKFVRYIATLDTSTCPVCGGYHGQRFPISEAPRLPIHDRCRCSLIADEFIDGEGIASYEQFFDGLSPEEQKEILGKTRYELYKRGVGVSSFVDSGKKLTLQELTERGINLLKE